MKRIRPVAFAMAAMLIVGMLAPSAFAAVGTSQADYAPGSTVTISGDNSNDAGYAAGDAVHVDVAGPNGYTASCDATADDSGAWSCQVVLWGNLSAVGDYSYTATSASGVTENGTFSDGPDPVEVLCPTLTAYNPTHFALQAGHTATCTIVHATLVGSPSTVNVYIRSSTLGNETVTGTVSAGPAPGDTITFSYTGRSDGCSTTNIGYDENGTPNNERDAHAGFAFVNSAGENVACGSQTSTTTVVHTDSPDAAITGALTEPASAHDSATVTSAAGTPTGSVEFLFFSGSASSAECTGNHESLGSVALNGSGVAHPSPSRTNLVAGSYAFQAIFHATGAFGDSTGPCEPFIVTGPGGGGELPLDLTVSKTATLSFTRTYTWGITKDVDRTLVEQIGGGTATFLYTVNASQTGFTDSDWAVEGTITVTNPNDWEAITFALSDAIDNGGTCTIDGGGTDLSVAASKSTTADYSCTYAAAPDRAAFTNTATATWDAAAAATPTGSADGTATGAFGAPTKRVHQTINVTDTFDGGAPTQPGTLTATDATPYASASFPYSRVISVPTWNCLSYANTATIFETEQSASRTVEVCGPARTGALTMGFWQNKNGQALIASANQASLLSFLKGFAPFGNATSPLTTYVTSVIKAANASGASMNAMLKGQMLATTLDVYFSSSGLGGVTIDLTKVCKNIAAGCTTYENVSSSFGGATSLTVSQMLTYAASRSDLGGSIWYAQVKNGPNSQELAKDAFDAINNQVVFAP